MSLVICRHRGFTYRAVRYCHWCERRRRFVISEELWYGAVLECGGCGHRWSEDGRERQTNKARALRRHGFAERWATAHTRAEHDAWLRREVQVMGA